MARVSVFRLILPFFAATLAACNCVPDIDEPEDDGGVVEVPDSGPAFDGGPKPKVDNEVWLPNWAAEPCPEDVFSTPDGGYYEVVDGGYRLGICIKLHSLDAEVTLNGVPDSNLIETYFVAAGYGSEYKKAPDSNGHLHAKVMRAKYDSLRHQPGGVWPNFRGYIDHGYGDFTRDQTREFATRTHLVRGGVHYGGLPFIPNSFPQDVWFNAFGAPAWQMSMVTSQGGSYELKMVEGRFSMLLNTPRQSLYGTELVDYNVLPGAALDLTADKELDIDIPTSVVEATITIDGQPLPNARSGPDYSLIFSRQGDNASTVFSYHEGGVPGISALVPKGKYGVALTFDGAAHRSFPTRIEGLGLQAASGIDLNHDNSFTQNIITHPIESGVLIDGRPPTPNPFYNFRLYFFASATQTSGGGMMFFEVPMEAASFTLRALPGMYFVVAQLDEGLAPNLATGWWLLNRQYLHFGPNNLAVSLDTSRISGRVKVDGRVPDPTKTVGTLSFRNRALEGQWSWFYSDIVPSEDGSYEVRLPKGEYDVFFQLNGNAYPSYASGRVVVASRVDLTQDYNMDLNYETIELSGPLRIDGVPVPNSLPGFEYGLRMISKAGEFFNWQGHGGTDEFRVRVPTGTYDMAFLIHEGALDHVAFGRAPMGFRLNLPPASDLPFFDFLNY